MSNDVKELIFANVLRICNPDTRYNAMVELIKFRDNDSNLILGPILWYSFGTISSLLQEIVCIYPLLASEQKEIQLTRAYNALALLQAVASHNETRKPFFEGLSIFLKIRNYNTLISIHFDIPFSNPRNHTQMF